MACIYIVVLYTCITLNAYVQGRGVNEICIRGIWNGAAAWLIGPFPGVLLLNRMSIRMNISPMSRLPAKGTTLISNPHPIRESLHGSLLLLVSFIGTYVSDWLSPENLAESSCLYTGYVWHVKLPLWLDEKRRPAILTHDMNISAPCAALNDKIRSRMLLFLKMDCLAVCIRADGFCGSVVPFSHMSSTLLIVFACTFP